MSTTWNKMSLHDRITAVHVDISNNKIFAGLSGVTYVGNVNIDDTSTACTNGRDVWYGIDFIKDMTRKQLRYLVLHENLHKALQHCTSYLEVVKQHQQLSGMAMDYVVNGTIEEMDTKLDFVERPTNIPPLIDPKYFGWSFIEVLRDLLQNPPPDGGKGGGTLDEHKMGELDGDAQALTAQEISDAIHQGDILVKKLAGNESRNDVLQRAAQKRDTNWRQHVRTFITQICEGDEYSRFVPPNKRMLPAGFIMPSHFAEATGELIIAPDTSGSMDSILPLVFGEVAQICRNVNPDKVRVLWWDTEVCGDQEFKPHEFQSIATLLKPRGGGGTSPQCVVEHIAKNQYKPRAVIWLTDGYLDGSATDTGFPALWGVVDNDHFVPSTGKVVRIYSH